jgi:hypothetical protein
VSKLSLNVRIESAKGDHEKDPTPFLKTGNWLRLIKRTKLTGNLLFPLSHCPSQMVKSCSTNQEEAATLKETSFSWASSRFVCRFITIYDQISDRFAYKGNERKWSESKEVRMRGGCNIRTKMKRPEIVNKTRKEEREITSTRKQRTGR